MSLQALLDLVQRLQVLLDRAPAAVTAAAARSRTAAAVSGTLASNAGSLQGAQAKPFDSMNNIVANLLLNLTAYYRSHSMLCFLDG